MKLINLFIFIYLLFIYSCESPIKENNDENILYIDNISSSSYDIFYSSNTDIAGLQFSLSGIEILNVSGGIFEQENFSVSFGPLAVIAFSFEGMTIPPGNGLLTTIEFNRTDFESCLKDIIFVDIDSNILEFDIGSCVDTGCDDFDNDLVCDDIDLCIGEVDLPQNYKGIHMDTN